MMVQYFSWWTPIPCGELTIAFFGAATACPELRSVLLLGALRGGCTLIGCCTSSLHKYFLAVATESARAVAVGGPQASMRWRSRSKTRSARCEAADPRADNPGWSVSWLAGWLAG